MQSRLVVFALFLLVIGLSHEVVFSAENTIHLPILFQPTDEIFVSEFMASNGGTVLDDDGESSDWIELYKKGPSSIDLTGWYLTDNSHNLTKWELPAVGIRSEQYLLIYASGKDRTDPTRTLHTNFKLKSGGEYLALVRPDGQTIAWESGVNYPSQFQDISYGYDLSGNLRYFMDATPGWGNSAEKIPLIHTHTHIPNEPTTNSSLIINTHVQQTSAPIQSVTLEFRINLAPTVTLTMRDDGLSGDGGIDDGVYGVILQNTTYDSGDLVRYAFTATDSLGNETRWPLRRSDRNTPHYFGTMVTDPTLQTALPVLHWFIDDPLAARTRTGTQATLYYNGMLYDNIFVRMRGRTSAFWPKKNFKFEFNRGEGFVFSDTLPPVSEFNLNSTWEDPSYMRTTLAWQTYQEAQVQAALSFPVRVQQNGDFYSVAAFVEQPNEQFLNRLDLDPNGALYKAVCCNTFTDPNNLEDLEKKTRLHETNADLRDLVAGINGDRPSRYIYDHVNLPNVINTLAASTLILDWDHIVHNYYLYRDSDGSGEWYMFPWDKDHTFNPDLIHNDDYNHILLGSRYYPYPGGWNGLLEALFANSTFRTMYLRRLRTLMDDSLETTNVPYDDRVFEQRITQLAHQIRPDAALDKARWSSAEPFEDALNALRNDFLDGQRYNLFGRHGSWFPASQMVHPPLQIAAVDANPASGNQSEEYIHLRNLNEFAVDLTGWQITNGVDFTFAPGTVFPPNSDLYIAGNLAAFRTRTTSPTAQEYHFVVGNYTRNLDNEGETLDLLAPDNTLIDTFTYTLP